MLILLILNKYSRERKRTFVVHLFLLFIFTLPSCAQRNSPQYGSDHGILLIPTEFKNTTKSKSLYYYILDCIPQVGAKVKIFPEERKKFITIENIIAGMYEIVEIKRIRFPGYGFTGIDSTNFEINEPYKFKIYKNTLTILSYMFLADQGAISEDNSKIYQRFDIRDLANEQLEEIRKLVKSSPGINSMYITDQNDLETETKESIRDLANQGDAEAQFELGEIYRKSGGYHIQQDIHEAIKWYKLAAEQGHIEAQYRLGLTHRGGPGDIWNYQEAVKWLQLAAENGHMQAQYYLGYSYEFGEGVAYDYHLAAKWYKASAKQGYDRAQNQLEILCEQKPSVCN